MNTKGELIKMYNGNPDRKRLVLESISQSVPRQTMVKLIMKNDELTRRIFNGFNSVELVDLVRKHSNTNKNFINSITTNNTAGNVKKKVESKEKNERNRKERMNKERWNRERMNNENEERRKMANEGGDFDGYR